MSSSSRDIPASARLPIGRRSEARASSSSRRRSQIREVGVLDGERVERGQGPGETRLVEGRQLAPEYCVGPAIRDNVVHRQQQYMVFVCEAQKGGADEWAARQVEWSPGLPESERRHPLVQFARGDALQIHNRQEHAARGVDDLAGVSVQAHEPSAQNVMALNDVPQTLGQGFRPKRTAELDDFKEVVCVAAESQLVEEPEALLGVGQRQAIIPRYR